MMNSVDGNHWQETLAETLEGVPEEHKQKVSGFLIGYLAALKEEVKTHEEHQV